jgi:predicted anti-sigma-YlaC factor YlaD
MNHNKIQKKFLLYFDGDLSASDKSAIDQHLNECAHCKKLFREVSEIWGQESNFEQPIPSPKLWYELKNRLEKETVRPLFINKLVDAKLLFESAIKIGMIAVSIFIGSRFGYIISLQSFTSINSVAQIENISDDFGLSYFEAVPPGSLAKEILVTGNLGRGSK